MKRLVRLGAAALGLLGVFAFGDHAATPNRRDLVLVTIDTLRADRLGLYGGDAPTSPFLDALAADAVVFENAIATCPATAPATASLLTGLHRASHGVARNGSALPEPVVTLAEILHGAGYRTIGLVANPSLDAPLGFGQGFDSFAMPDGLARDGPGRFAGAALVDAARPLLDALGDEPVFLWVHFMDPHGAYFPPESYRARFDPERYRWPGDRDLLLSDQNHGLGLVPHYQGVAGEATGAVVAPRSLRARYDAEIRYADDQVAALVDLLRRRDRWDRTLFVVAADHGESLGEHELYFQHGWFAYEDALRIPLLVRAPGMLAAGRRVAASVSTIDVAPTLLALLGVTPRTPMEGESLLPVIRGDEGDRAAFAQTYYGNRQVAVRVGASKFIYTPPPPAPDDRRPDGWRDAWPTHASEELYDLAADPGERVNRAPEDTAAARLLRRRVELWLADQGMRGKSLVHALRRDPATRPDGQRLERELRLEEMLRSLGYAE